MSKILKSKGEPLVYLSLVSGGDGGGYFWNIITIQHFVLSSLIRVVCVAILNNHFRRLVGDQIRVWASTIQATHLTTQLPTGQNSWQQISIADNANIFLAVKPRMNSIWFNASTTFIDNATEPPKLPSLLIFWTSLLNQATLQPHPANNVVNHRTKSFVQLFTRRKKINWCYFDFIAFY